jgi:glycosyltransferase involved in cell wall biosynthesis
MNRGYSLSVIVPVYNEIQLLEKAIAEVNSFVSKYFFDYEILLIESGSTDGSDQACDKIGRENPHIKVIHEGARKGFGSALKLGYKNASKDLLWLITADLPFPLPSILDALPLLDKYDCVLSFRLSDDRGFLRKVLSFSYNGIMKALLGLDVKHINSAFKLYKKEIIQNLPLISNGWFLDTEVLYWLRKRNIKSIEIPVPLVNRTAGESKISPMTPFFMLAEALKFICLKKSIE